MPKFQQTDPGSLQWEVDSPIAPTPNSWPDNCTQGCLSPTMRQSWWNYTEDCRSGPSTMSQFHCPLTKVTRKIHHWYFTLTTQWRSHQWTLTACTTEESTVTPNSDPDSTVAESPMTLHRWLANEDKKCKRKSNQTVESRNRSQTADSSFKKTL